MNAKLIKHGLLLKTGTMVDATLIAASRSTRNDKGEREFISRALLRWAVDEGPESVLIEPCNLWQNGTNESFNGKFRDDCLSMD